MQARLASDELRAGEGLDTQILRVRLGESHVLVARLTTGEVVAFAPVCPHQFTELDEAAIRDGNLRCPRHGYIYDARSGENVHPGRDTSPENLWKVRPGYLPCYQVTEDGGWISVSDEACPLPDTYDPALEERPIRGTDADADADADVDVDAAAGAAVAGGSVGAVEQSVKFLSVVSASTFDIRLPVVPRPGFAWRFDVVGVGQLLRVVDDQFESGYSPCHLVRVATEGVGAATLTCTYETEQGEKAEIRTFIVRVASP